MHYDVAVDDVRGVRQRESDAWPRLLNGCIDFAAFGNRVEVTRCSNFWASGKGFGNEPTLTIHNFFNNSTYLV